LDVAIIAMGRIAARQKRQVWAATGVCFLTNPLMTLHCGSGGLREK
jgi:hypothetical protein